jgi:hypothetical protein
MIVCCDFHRTEQGLWQCRFCGFLVPAHPERPKRVCAEEMGLGDYTERMLERVGVTQDRYTKAKSLFGLAPTCGCSERKEWLNAVGAWLSSISGQSQ